MFAYCDNDPINYRDLTGNAPIREAGLGGGGGLAYAGGWSKGAGLKSVVRFAINFYKFVNGAYKLRSYVNRITTNRASIDYDDCYEYSVYVMYEKNDSNNVGYVGITNDPGRRSYEHSRNPQKDSLGLPQVKYTGLTHPEARVMEQLLISTYGLSDLQNARYEISIGKVFQYLDEMFAVAEYFPGMTGWDVLGLMEG